MAEWCPHFRLPPSYFVSVFLASLAFLFCFFKREFIISSSWKNNKINGTFIEIAIVISLSCLFFPYNNLECISIFVNSLFKCFIVFFFFLQVLQLFFCLTICVCVLFLSSFMSSTSFSSSFFFVVYRHLCPYVN